MGHVVGLLQVWAPQDIKSHTDAAQQIVCWSHLSLSSVVSPHFSFLMCLSFPPHQAQPFTVYLSSPVSLVSHLFCLSFSPHFSHHLLSVFHTSLTAQLSLSPVKALVLMLYEWLAKIVLTKGYLFVSSLVCMFVLPIKTRRKIAIMTRIKQV